MSQPSVSQQSVLPPLPAQRWVLAVMALFPERRGPDGDFIGVLTRPWNTRQALEFLQAEGLYEADEVRREIMLLRASACESDPIYKLARASLLCARAHAAYFFSMDEAWRTALDCARSLQKQCSGWFSMAEACLRGMKHHLGEAASQEAREAFYALHARPDSPWNQVQWRTLLAGELPAPAESGEALEVKDTASLHAALASAAPGTVLQLHPGRYEGPLHLTQTALTLRGGAEVLVTLPEGVEGPLIRSAGSLELVDLMLRAHGKGTLVEAHGDFVRLEGCELEGAELGLDLRSDYAQLMGCRFAQLGEAARIDSLHVRTEVLLFGEGVGLGLHISARAEVCLNDALELKSEQTAFQFRRELVGGRFRLRGSRVHQGRVELSHIQDVQLVESRLDGGLGLSHCEAQVESCHLSGANKVRGGRTTFHHCHFLDAERCNLELSHGHHTHLIGGQLGQVRKDGSNLCVEGGWTRLERVSLGPSQGRNLTWTSGEGELLGQLELDEVVCSAAQSDAVVMKGKASQAPRLFANKLRVRNAWGLGVQLEHIQAEFTGLDMADISGECALLLKGSTAHVCGLGLRGVQDGIHAREASCLLLVDVALGALEGALISLNGEQTRAAVVSSMELSASVNERALLVLRGVKLKPKGVCVNQASIELEALTLPLHGLQLIESKARLTQVHQDEDALHLDELSSVQEAPPARSGTAMSPLLIPLRAAPFARWGLQAQPRHLQALAELVARRLGYEGRLGVRETPQGIRVDGPLPLVARFSPTFDTLLRSEGALGLALAELLGANALS